MKKEFKWKPGDEVWVMFNDKVIQGKITRAWYRKGISCVDYESISEVESYYVSSDLTGGKELQTTFELEDLYPDKESLLKSL